MWNFFHTTVLHKFLCLKMFSWSSNRPKNKKRSAQIFKWKNSPEIFTKCLQNFILSWFLKNSWSSIFGHFGIFIMLHNLCTITRLTKRRDSSPCRWICKSFVQSNFDAVCFTRNHTSSCLANFHVALDFFKLG